eukprot:364110-Chlamydomonas_euryale.AAC.2
MLPRSSCAAESAGSCGEEGRAEGGGSGRGAARARASELMRRRMLKGGGGGGCRKKWNSACRWHVQPSMWHMQASKHARGRGRDAEVKGRQEREVPSSRDLRGCVACGAAAVVCTEKGASHGLSWPL